MILSFLMLVFSCSEQKSFSEIREQNISLISPNGISIATSIEALKSRVEENALMAFGNKNFYFSNITYTETNKAIAAFIEFNSIDKEYGSVLLVGNLTAKSKNLALANSTVVDCNGGCDTAGATCRERVRVFSNGNIEYECTCQGSCKLTVTNEK